MAWCSRFDGVDDHAKASRLTAIVQAYVGTQIPIMIEFDEGRWFACWKFGECSYRLSAATVEQATDEWPHILATYGFPLRDAMRGTQADRGDGRGGVL